MNVAWPPGSRKGCGHPSCRRYTIASGAALLGADAVVLGAGVTAGGQAHPVITVAAGCVIAAAGLVLGLLPHPRQDDMLALVEATRECRCCSPEDYGACTCTRYCGVIRCSAGFGGMPPTPPRLPGRAARQDIPDCVPDEWTRENT